MTVDNIVKMWHSIEQAWYLMEAHATREHIQYQRVAMLRSDVVYMTPINIWETGDPGVMDTENTVVVIPGTYQTFNESFFQVNIQRKVRLMIP